MKHNIEVAVPKVPNSNSIRSGSGGSVFLLPCNIKIPFLPSFEQTRFGGGGASDEARGVFGRVSKFFLLMRAWNCWEVPNGVPSIYQQNKFLEIVSETAHEVGE